MPYNNEKPLIAGIADQRWYNAEAAHLISIMFMLKRENFRVMVISPDITEYNAAIESMNLKGPKLPRTKHLSEISVFVAVRKLLSKHNPAWIFTSSQSSFFGAFSAAVLNNSSSVFSSELNKSFPRFAVLRGKANKPSSSFINRKFYSLADLHIASCHIISEKHLSPLGIKAHVIRQPANEDVFMKSSKVLEDKRSEKSMTSDKTLRILCVGRFDPVKGHSLLIEAASVAVKNNIDLELVLLGPEKNLTREYLQAVADQHGISDKVKFIKPSLVTPDSPWGTQVAVEMEKADVLAVPSLGSELNCRVLIEGMASGLPAIVSDTGSLPEVCAHNHSGLVFRNGSVLELSQCIIKMSDKSYRRKLANQALNDYVNLYSLDSACNRLKLLMNQKEQSDSKTEGILY